MKAVDDILRKMREALSDACYAMHNFLKTQNGGCDETAKALDKAKSALSAPPRNCDKYNTTRSATRKWAEITGASIYAEGDGNDWRKFFHWLFAPAQEGGAE